MSGIYIKGMEMPATCCHCAFMYFDPDAENSNNGKPGSYLCSFTKEEIWNTQRDPACPLVLVPDHGRLVDADALVRDNGIKEIPEYYEVVRDAPTIIPADFVKDTNVPTKTADKEHHCKYCCHWENKENPCPWGYMYDDDEYVSDCMDFERADKEAGE